MGAIKNIFSPPKPKLPPPPPPVPQVQSKEVQRGASEERLRQARQRGSASTILSTQGLGDETTATKRLLGG